jgi:hypothetical protein
VFNLLRKIHLGEDPDLATVNHLLDVDSIGAIDITASSFIYFHVVKRQLMKIRDELQDISEYVDMYYVQESVDWLTEPGRAIHKDLRIEAKKCDYDDFKLGPNDDK